MAKKPWWRDLRGMPAYMERRVRTSGLPLTPMQIWVVRMMPLFFVGFVALTRVWILVIPPAVLFVAQWLTLTAEQRRQVMGRDRRNGS